LFIQTTTTILNVRSSVVQVIIQNRQAFLHTFTRLRTGPK
jgi:hypothetical protein